MQRTWHDELLQLFYQHEHAWNKITISAVSTSLQEKTRSQIQLGNKHKGKKIKESVCYNMMQQPQMPLKKTILSVMDMGD